MAVDKLVDSAQLDADLTSVANAIRTKGGTSAQLAFPSGFVSAVQAIPTGSSPTGTKQISITQNGTVTENVSGYANAEITANVPNTYTAGDEGKVVSSGVLVSQTSATYTTNNTYDTTLINSVTVNVSGSSIQFKTGTYTPAQDYTGTAKHEIVSLSTIGFTPSVFVFRCNDKNAISGIKYEIVYLVSDTRWPLRLCTYYSNTSNSVACLTSATSWTGERNGHLYCDGTAVYVKTAGSTAYLKGGAEYIWEAYA